MKKQLVPLEKRCANGKFGCDTVRGKLYAVERPCMNEKLHGHILCESCRRQAGGYAA